MKILNLIIIITLTGCVTQKHSYDPYSEVKNQDFGSWYKGDPIDEDLITPERRQLQSYRYWHDMEEAEILLFYQGLKESYRFIFTGDHEPFILVRINHWGWNKKYTVSLRLKMESAYSSTSCIYDPEQKMPEKCPKTEYSRIENYEISKETWLKFKQKIKNLNFFSYSPAKDPAIAEQQTIAFHGAHWQFEGILETENAFLTNRFDVLTPPQGQLYDVGEFLLTLVGENKWLERTKF